MKILLASLVVLSSSLAHADRPTPRMPRCTKLNDPPVSILTIRRDSDRAKDYAASTLNVFNNGAWTYVDRGRSENGCLDLEEARALERALVLVTWKFTLSPQRCALAAPEYVEYSYKRTPVLRTELCDRKVLDDATLKGLAVANGVAMKIYASLLTK